MSAKTEAFSRVRIDALLKDGDPRFSDTIPPELGRLYGGGTGSDLPNDACHRDPGLVALFSRGLPDAWACRR